MYKCHYGCGSIAQYYKKYSKKWCCSENVNSCPGMRKKFSQAQINHSISRGRTYEELHGAEKALNLKSQRSEQAKHGIFVTDNPLKNAKNRKLASERINARYKKGWMPKAGRCKKIKYTTRLGIEISVDGTWELQVAKYFDSLNIKWHRNTKRFSYINLKRKESFYTPDFYVEEYDCYVEVKGYETELDRCKWNQFNNILLIFKYNELNSIKKILERGQAGNAADC